MKGHSLVIFSLLFINYHLINGSANSFDNGLHLSTILRSGQAVSARNQSRVDSNSFLGVESYAGYITVKNKSNSNLFFWYFPVKNKPVDKTPWIIFLQGGPGYTSLKAVFGMIGPFDIVNGKLKLVDGTWSSDYSVLFIDNPVGTGYSYTTEDSAYATNEEDVREQLHEFLVQFLEIFPELRKAPLFIAGQSYAGKYVPAFAHKIHQNKQTTGINLRGIYIGNGMIDPKSMMCYTELAEFLGLVDNCRLGELKKIEEDTIKAMDEKRMIDAANGFNQTIELIKSLSGVAIFHFNQDPQFEAPKFEEFVQRRDIRKLLHAGDWPFDLNNQLVYTKMLPDIMNSTKPLLEELLEHYGVLCISGQMDVILPYFGSKKTYALLKWSRRSEYDNSQRQSIRRKSDTAIVAYKKSGGNFVEVLVRRAGHNVPADQPRVTKRILDEFIEEFRGK